MSINSRVANRLKTYMIPAWVINLEVMYIITCLLSMNQSVANLSKKQNEISLQT